MPSKILMKGKMNVYNSKDCHEQYRSLVNYKSVKLTSNQFCAKGRNKNDRLILACLGDSGAPAYRAYPEFDASPYYILHGVTSWGPMGEYFPRCRDERGPNAFVNVYSYLNWILDVTESYK